MLEYYLTGKDNRLFEVCSDAIGSRVWINADDGSSVARFNTKTGVDIHNTASEQMAGEPECLWCTHSKPDYATWQKFVLEIKKQHGVELSIDAIDVGLLA